MNETPRGGSGPDPDPGPGLPAEEWRIKSTPMRPGVRLTRRGRRVIAVVGALVIAAAFVIIGLTFGSVGPGTSPPQAHQSAAAPSPQAPAPGQSGRSPSTRPTITPSAATTSPRRSQPSQPSGAPSSATPSQSGPLPSIAPTPSPADVINTVGWTTGSKRLFVAATTAHPVTWVIIGLHGNYDRVTLVLNDHGRAKATDQVGFSVMYVGTSSVLEVTIDAPAHLDVQPGHAIVRPRSLQGWPELRGLRYGGSDAGHTLIFIRAASQVPFEVSTGLSLNHNRLVSIDLAHQ